MIRLIALILIFSASNCANSDTDNSNREQTSRKLDFTATVSFLNADGEDISSVDVTIADDNRSRSEGLMNVHELPENSGMLFIFEDEEPRSFWMANTPLSLDIIFVNSNFEIVRIHRNTPPYSHQSFRSEEPAMYVVEVNAGYTLRHDITEGMKIRIDD